MHYEWSMKDWNGIQSKKSFERRKKLDNHFNTGLEWYTKQNEGIV